MKGDQGHLEGHRRLTAADGTRYLESAEKYGAWQVKKLYLHLYDTASITMDWRVPLAAFDGKTALYYAKKNYHPQTTAVLEQVAAKKPAAPAAQK